MQVLCSINEHHGYLEDDGECTLCVLMGERKPIGDRSKYPRRRTVNENEIQQYNSLGKRLARSRMANGCDDTMKQRRLNTKQENIWSKKNITIDSDQSESSVEEFIDITGLKNRQSTVKDNLEEEHQQSITSQKNS